MNKNRLSVIVTGGVSGIGEAVVKLCLKKNYQVGVIDINQNKGEELLQKNKNNNLFFFKADVTNQNSLEDAFSYFNKKMTNLNGCVTCAGIIPSREKIENHNQKDFIKIINSHLSGTFLSCKIASKFFSEKSGGSIVTLSSVLSIRPGPVLAYGAAKAGIVNLTQALAVHWARKNIRINSISPGWVDTPFIRTQEKEGRDLSPVINLSPMGRMVKPIEIANIVLFLLSPLSSAMTGSNIVADCGITLSGGYLPYGDLP